MGRVGIDSNGVVSLLRALERSSRQFRPAQVKGPLQTDNASTGKLSRKARSFTSSPATVREWRTNPQGSTEIELVCTLGGSAHNISNNVPVARGKGSSALHLVMTLRVPYPMGSEKGLNASQCRLERPQDCGQTFGGNRTPAPVEGSKDTSKSHTSCRIWVRSISK